MKKTLLITLLLISSITTAWCQWTSPGNGTTYTLRDLVETSEGCVTYVDTLIGYVIHGDLTIAPNDCLKVMPEDCQDESSDLVALLSDGDFTLTIQGSMRIDNETLNVQILPVPEGYRLRLRFENSTQPSYFRNTMFTQLSGIQIIESEVTFQTCLFQSFDKDYSSGAVTYMYCDPVFDDCIFQGNYGSAISSAVNVTGSPQITKCEFRYNVLSKENMPQLNLGPGGDDTIRIVNCRVIGLYPPVGGISIADLMQVGDTKVLLKGNFIGDNRYGYNQQGYSISSVITDNEIVCNQIEVNPMNGGSGISIYGATADCKAKIRNNLITNNIWGITVISNALVDLGTENDYGNNMIFDNHNDSDGTDRLYALYVNGVNDVNAIGNYWGGDTEAFAESVIYHRPDLGDGYGLVHYSPILPVNSWNIEVNQSLKASVYPNPTDGLVTLHLDEADGFTYEIHTLLGQRVMEGRVEGQETILDLGSYPKGIYLVSIRTDASKAPIIQQIIR